MDSIDDHNEQERNFGDDLTNLPEYQIKENQQTDNKPEEGHKTEPLARQKCGIIPHLTEVFDFLCSREVPCYFYYLQGLQDIGIS
jgi:hypothetical protein